MHIDNQSAMIAPENHVASIPTLISRTALDSLHAKLSAIDGGWLDGGGGGGNPFKNGNVTSYQRPAIHDTYCKLLRLIGDNISDEEGQPQRRRRRRQTPLVNAGYAARMAVMTYSFEHWMGRIIAPDVMNHRRSQSEHLFVNVVLLGCGMDALGICSKHFLHDSRASEKKLSDDYGRASEDSDTPTLPRVRVYEFDAWDNCILKKNAMVQSGLLTESFTFGNVHKRNTSDHMSTNATGQRGDDNASKSSFRTISKGRLAVEHDEGDHDQSNDDDDYFLMALDFRETTSIGDDESIGKRQSILSLAMKNIGLDPSHPTIVLSELVLAYLGIDGANATMHSIATDVVCGNPNSLFICLEPVFLEAAGGCGELKMLSVEESYSREYSHQFLGTLQRGDSRYASKSKGRTGSSSSSWMHPLGSNSRSVMQRLRNCGFSPPNVICCATLGEAAANVAHLRRMSNNAPSFLQAKEPFDEHAALALNLNCYGVVCVFSSIPSTRLKDVSEDLACDIWPWFQKYENTPTIEVNPIASSLDDKHVRDFYGRIYVHLYSQYPVIRKMVKSAMKTDLHDEESSCSAIRYRYLSKGGNFWIATDPHKSLMVGCVGVGLRIAKEKNEILSSSSVVEYDIHRLAVDDQYRGMGIGKKLLSIAEEYTLQQESDAYMERSSATVKLWAVTPNCMTNANKLYESMGYGLEETFQAGTLCMNVYCKAFQLVP
ncbi:hypothetical protein ACHAXH_003790 [Discostella pseudostelligera]